MTGACCIIGCRERRRLREMAGLEGKDSDEEDEQVGRCRNRAANADDMCPAAAHGYAISSAPCERARCLSAHKDAAISMLANSICPLSALHNLDGQKALAGCVAKRYIQDGRQE